MKNWKIGTRLGAGFAVILLLLIAIAVLGISRLAAINQRMEEITKVNNVEAYLAATMRGTVSDRMIVLRNIVLLSDIKEMQPEVERLQAQADKYRVAEEKLKKLFASAGDITPEEQEVMKRLAELESVAAPLMSKIAEFGLANKNDEATRLLMRDLRPIQAKWMAAVSDLINIENKQSDQSALDAEAEYNKARLLMVVLSLAAVLGGAVIAWLLTRSITVPMNIAVQVAQTVAGGDLSSAIDVNSRDETGQLLHALKGMNDSLVKIVGEVRNGTDTIATASSQIATGNLDLSSRTEQQAGSLEETASSLEELTSTVRQNADNAHQANTLAAAASEVAVKGGAMVGQVVETMTSINESSKKIVDIIGVIDGIAFQTNILALNAAVEAARAGEQGRGFAVVASEVRNLAQRSAQAAKEVKHLIDDSVVKVSAGTQLVDQAGSTMHEIVSSVRRVSDIISEITAASSEQTTGIEQINLAVNQMDQVTQQNAALVEEAAAAAASMQEQAATLAQVVGVFKLGSHAAAVQAAPVAAAPPVAVARANTARRAVATPPRISAAKPARASSAVMAASKNEQEWEEF